MYSYPWSSESTNNNKNQGSSSSYSFLPSFLSFGSSANSNSNAKKRDRSQFENGQKKKCQKSKPMKKKQRLSNMSNEVKGKSTFHLTKHQNVHGANKKKSNHLRASRPLKVPSSSTTFKNSNHDSDEFDVVDDVEQLLANKKKKTVRFKADDENKKNVKVRTVAKQKAETNSFRRWIKNANADFSWLKNKIFGHDEEIEKLKKEITKLKEKGNPNDGMNFYLVAPKGHNQREIGGPKVEQSTAQNMQRMMTPFVATLNEAMNHSNNASEQQQRPININFICLNQTENREYNKTQTLYNKNAPTIHKHVTTASPFSRSNVSSNYNNRRSNNDDGLFFEGSRSRNYFNC